MPKFIPDAIDSVSVVMPTYNRAHSLSRAIHSVLAQTHENLELIIADDASTDDTEKLVHEWAKNDSRVIYLRQSTNQGAAAARNLGLGAARGNFVSYQDSDDEWLLKNLEMQLSALREAGPEYCAVFGIKVIYGHDEFGNYGYGRVAIAPDRNRPVVSGCISGQLLHGNLISPQTLLLRADLAARLGGFDPLLPANNDWEYMLRLAQETKILHLPEPVVLAYISQDSIHRKLRNKARSFLRIIRKHEALFAQDNRAYSDRMFTVGRYLHQMGKFRAASICMRKAIRATPLRPRIWGGLVASSLRKS